MKTTAEAIIQPVGTSIGFVGLLLGAMYFASPMYLIDTNGSKELLFDFNDAAGFTALVMFFIGALMTTYKSNK